MRYAFLGAVLAALLAGGPPLFPAEGRQGGKKMSAEFSEREEFRESYQLSPGAAVELENVPFGAVVVEPTDDAAVQVHMVRSARTREELACNRFVVEQTPDGLRLRSNENHDCRLQNVSVEQKVVLKVPRGLSVAVSTVSGPVRVGEFEGRGPNFVNGPGGEKIAQPADRPHVVGRGFDGTVSVRSISGPVTILQGGGRTSVSGVSGPVGITFRGRGVDGVRVSGVNGLVELRLTSELNADLLMRDIRGEVRDLGAGIKLDNTEKGGFRSQLGAGGTPISISSVNGDVILRRD